MSEKTPHTPAPLVTVRAHHLDLTITTAGTGYARILHTDNVAVRTGSDSGVPGRDLVLAGPTEGPAGQAHLDLAPGVDLYLDLENCRLDTGGPDSSLGRVELLAKACTVNLGRVAELGITATASDTTAHVSGTRLTARLTAAGLTAHLDRPTRVGLTGDACTATLAWAPGARGSARYTDTTTRSHIHHTER